MRRDRSGSVLVALTVVVAAGCRGAAGTVDGALADATAADGPVVDARPIDATVDARPIDATVDAAIDAGPPPPPCAVPLHFDIGTAALPVGYVTAARTAAGWLFVYGPPTTGDPAAGLSWTLVGFDGQRLVPPSQLAPGVWAGAVAVNGDRALVGYSANAAGGGQSAVVRIIDLVAHAAGPSIVLGTAPTMWLDLVLVGPGAGFRAISGVMRYPQGTSQAWFDADLTTLGADGALVAVQALPTLGGGFGPSVATGNDDVALGSAHQRPVDNCFACTVAALARLASDGTLTEGWPIPFVEHYDSGISSLAQIGPRLHVAWESESPSFHVPLRFATLARDPGDILLSVPWADRMEVVAGGPRDGVLGVRRQIPEEQYLQSFDSAAAFVLGGACSIDLAPAQLLAAGGPDVLVVGDDGRAEVVTAVPELELGDGVRSDHSGCAERSPVVTPRCIGS